MRHRVSFPRLLVGVILTVLLALTAVLATQIGARSGHAAAAHAEAPLANGPNGLSVFVGYAEDKETNNPNPTEFPVPWMGAPNTIFLGGTVPGQNNCGTLPLCYDAGAIRLDNPGATDVAVT